MKATDFPKRARCEKDFFNEEIWSEVRTNVNKLFGAAHEGLNTTSVLALKMRNPDAQGLIVIILEGQESIVFPVGAFCGYDPKKFEIVDRPRDETNALLVLQTALEGLFSVIYEAKPNGTKVRRPIAKDVREIRVGVISPGEESGKSYSLIEFDRA